MKIKGIGTISKKEAMSILTREGREAVKNGDITTQELGEMYKLEQVKGLAKSVLVAILLGPATTASQKALKRTWHLRSWGFW